MVSKQLASKNHGSDVFQTQENNFTLIRLLCSVAVIYGHSFALTPGLFGKEEKIVLWLTQNNFYSGSLAVFVFFVVSGSLITSSLIRLKSPLVFVMHRFFRIYPGLLASLAITAAACLFVFWPSGSLISWFLINGSGFTNSWDVSGVFELGPKYQALNGSLWSIPVELRAYVVVFLLALALGRHLNRQRLALAFLVLLFALLFQSDSLPIIGTSASTLGISGTATYVFAFLAGGLLFLLNVGALSKRYLAVICFVFALLFYLGFGDHLVLNIFICFGVVLAAKIPLPSKFQLKVDLSYGLYLYGWPVAQFVNYFSPNIEPEFGFVLALAISVLLAFVSWFAIEKPGIAVGKRLSEKISAKNP
jgi:peptidoglycan/LPS O-acetylase OafA/YrhL